MAITRTGNVISGSVVYGETLTLTLPSTTVSGNALVVVISAYYQSDTFTVSDSTAGTWATAVNYIDGAQIIVGYLQNITGTAGHQITVAAPSLATDYFLVTVIEYAGLKTSGTLIDVLTTNRAFGSTYSSGSISTAQAAELLLGVHHVDNGFASLTAGAGWTSAASVTDSSSHRHLVQDRITTASGVYASTGTVGPSTQFVQSVLVAFLGQVPTLVTGTITGSLSTPTCAASGTYTPLAISGTIAQSTSGITGTSSGAEIFSGTIVQSLDRASGGLSGFLIFTGTATGSLTAPTGTVSGVQSFSGPIVGSLSAPTCTGASGIQLFAGPIVVDLPPLGCVSSGSYTPVNLTGTIAASLSRPTCLASGTTGDVFAGTIAASLSAPTGIAAGTQIFSGTIAGSLQTPTSAASGTELFSGTIAGSLSVPTASGIGAQIFSGTVAVSISALTCLSAGTETLTGTITGSLPVPTCLALGVSGSFTGAIIASLSASTCAASGSEIFSGSIAGSLAVPTLIGSGALVFSGAIAGGLSAPTVSVTATARFVYFGPIDSVLRTPTCLITGVYTPLPITGSITASLHHPECIAWVRQTSGVEISDLFGIPGIYAPAFRVAGLYDVRLPKVSGVYDPRMLIKGISDVEPF